MATRAESLKRGLKRYVLGLPMTPCQEMVMQRRQWRLQAPMRRELIHKANKPKVVENKVIPMRRTFGQRLAALAATVLTMFTGKRGR